MRDYAPVLSAILISQSTISVAQSLQSIALPRVGQWEVNYDDNACHLIGRFGAGDHGIAMRITRYEPGDHFDLRLFGKQLQTGGQQLSVKLDFAIGDRPFERTAIAGQVGSMPVLIFHNLRLDGRNTISDAPNPAISASAEATVQKLTVAFKRPHLELETGPLDQPLLALRRCQDDLLRHWGYEPAVQMALSRRVKPIGNPAEWATLADFPMQLLRSERSGLVKFRLDISPTGAIDKCTVLERAANDEFSRRSCEIMQKRGRFKPALNKDKAPVASFWVSSILWLVPTD